MRITLEVDHRLMEAVLLLTGETTSAAAIRKALAEYVRRRKLDELRGLIGHMGLADDWREQEEAELKETRG